MTRLERVLLRGRELGYSGACSWFDVRAPLDDARRPLRAKEAWNVVILPMTDLLPSVELARDGAFALRKVREQCVAEPHAEVRE